MDESGGSGQPRSGNDGATDREEALTAKTADTAHPEEDRDRADARPTPAPAGDETEPTRPHEETTAAKPSPEETTTPVTRDGERAEAGTPRGEQRAPAPGDEPTVAPSSDEASTAGDPTAPASAGADDPAGPPPPDHPTTSVPPNADPAAGHPTAPTPSRPDGPDFPHHPTDLESSRTLAHTDLTGKGRPPQRPKEPGGGILMGRPFGVPVYVAPSWFLVAALITWVFGGQLDRVLPELGAARYLVSLFFAVAFYASVLVHELAHTVAALRFKLPVRRIQLQFFGGVSEIEKEAETPGREFVLAFVGPLLSLVLAGVFYLAMQPVQPGTVPGVLLAGLMISNLIVAAFNLLPGLPLDGGRMLRAVVWKITGRPMTGTIAAAWVGRALAVSVLIGLPLLTQSGALGTTAEDNVGMDTVTDALLAAILAAIIWTGAGNSLRMARLREHLPELRARTLTRRAVPVETDTPLSEALRRANDAGARALVVVDAHGEPLSLVREAAIVGVPEHRRPWVTVSGLAQELTDGMCVSAELAGEDLLDALRATPATEYLVVEETGEIYGVLSAADVERAFVKAMARPS
ncbi:site-2 protease family protein [Streptomyces yaanensis]|uniref:Site-2 protease family protein n=1 Tax=Streptomyces yaanensis TaxID=1142239 RepID=A0ABV7SM49_9ACTN|nr:site-2 protease family protein [Streptomyces sp. CGMCC 4.7035]WNC00821.1 site-2 protease family protein [Streptomyces sp. CGMCC 4.7035]